MRIRVTGLLKDKDKALEIHKFYGAMNNAPFSVGKFLCMQHYVVTGIETMSVYIDENPVSISITLTPCNTAVYDHVNFDTMFAMIKITKVVELKETVTVFSLGNED
jgi:hypothetical protein